jgi:hypothetical protein
VLKWLTLGAKSLRPRKVSSAVIDEEAVLLREKSNLPSKFALEDDCLHSSEVQFESHSAEIKLIGNMAPGTSAPVVTVIPLPMVTAAPGPVTSVPINTHVGPSAAPVPIPPNFSQSPAASSTPSNDELKSTIESIKVSEAAAKAKRHMI